MEGRVESWIFGVVLHHTILIVLARPEEVFNTTPPPLRTNFSCFGRVMGFYADIEANCKVYHTCDDHGNKFSYRCPEETAFRQDALICDHARLVDCCATTYDGKKSPRGSRAEENLGFNVPPLFNVPPSLDNSNDHRSFSRSFQVIQPPDKSLTDKTQPGFVFSARVFLRNRQDHDLHKKSMNLQETEQSTGSSILDKSRCNHNEEQKMTDSSWKNQFSQFSSTPRPFSRDSKEDSSLSNRFSSFTRSDLETKSLHGRTFVNVPTMISTKIQTPRKNTFQTTTVYSLSTKLPTNDIPRPNSNTYNNRDYPYFETLRSIQANAKSTTTTTSRTTITTTDIPVHALTMSLKPLVPNELEYDPYYPRIPTSTEAYYTDSHLNKGSESFRYTTQPSWSGIHFEIPAVLPDLNTLEDLVDRRKLFYIPRVTRN